MAIDYERMQRTHRVHKAALTRAKKKGFDAVRFACLDAVTEWDIIGAWPDNWSLWQRTLDDAAISERRQSVRLEDLR